MQADTSQRIEEQKLELVKALAGLVAPMDEILSDYKERQSREKRLLEKVEEVTTRLRAINRLMFAGSFIGAFIFVGLGSYVLGGTSIELGDRELIVRPLGPLSRERMHRACKGSEG